MGKWVANPKLMRADAHMPKIRAASKPEDAQAIAAFLATIGAPSTHAAQPKPSPPEIRKAESLFQHQHCDVCHFTQGVGVPDLNKISLDHVGAKFFPDSLVAYLEKPDAHFKWTRMPRFKLSREDCELLAAFLIARSKPAADVVNVASAETVQRGKTLVQTLGCLNCHQLNLPNKFSTTPLAQAQGAHGGCVGSSPAIDFGLSTFERGAIEGWLETGRDALSRNVPDEFAARHYPALRCAECHQKVEGVPGLNLLGEKLKPEWAAKFIGGETVPEPRPWLHSQMPSFPEYARGIAQGLAEQNGFAPISRTNAPVAALAQLGEDLVSLPPRGLGCAQCHELSKAGTRSDAPGIDFSLVASRLQPSYFQRWVRKPAAIDPQTKMPTFFTDEGKSPLTKFFGGDADKQIGAIWEYLQTRHQ
jgi:mono/diheme cytochrome c family protein